MRKILISILSVITAACLALSVPACGNSTDNDPDNQTEQTGGSSTDDNPDDQTEQTDGNSTDDNPDNQTEQTGGSSTDDNPDDQTEQTDGNSTDDNPDDQTEQTDGNQNNDGATIPEGAVTYLARANELGSEVQNVPTPSELSELSAASTSSAQTTSAKASAKSGKTALASTYSYAEDYVDLSSPEDNANYQDYLSSDRLMHDSYHTFMDYGDEYMRTFKDLTAIALESVVQFDTWVSVKNNNYVSNYFGRFRLSYDEITDMVTVEFLSDTLYSLEYVYITSTYNDDGKSVISGYIVTNSSPLHITTLNYVEDDYWEVLSEYQSDEIEWQAYNFLCGCDLSGESKEFFLYPGLSQVFLLKKTSPCFVDMRKELTSGYDSVNQEFYDCHSYYDYMYNSSAEKVGTWELIEIQNYFRLDFDIYELEGWDSFYYENETYYLTNGETVITGKDPFTYGNRSNYVTSQNGEYEYWIYISYSKDRIYMPALAININLLTDDATYYGAVCDLLQNIGISPKDEIVYEQLAYIDTREEIFTFDAFGLDGSESPSLELYQQISAQYKMQTISAEQMSEYDNETYINEYEQTEDKQYYFIFQPTVSGSVSFDSQSGEIDLSEISLTISAGALAVEGSEYAAIVIATDGVNYTELTRATAAYSGGSVTISWTENITVDMLTEKLTSGEYTIKYYAARLSDENTLKVSELTDIPAQGSYVLTADDYRVSITCGDSVKVVYEEYINPEITGETTADENGIALSTVSVTISADQLAVARGEYAAVIAAANESGELTELARASVQFISNDITISGFEDLSADDVEQLLPDGSYILKLYIVRAADGEEITLSDFYTINADGFTITDGSYAADAQTEVDTNVETQTEDSAEQN